MAIRAERHPRLLLHIANGDGVQGVESLANSLGVSVKTLRRDLASLRDLGVPIEERIGPHGQKTFWLAKEALPQIKFNYDEALALMLCRSSLESLRGTLIGNSIETAFEKIQGAIGPFEVKYLNKMLPRIHTTSTGGQYATQSDVIDALTCGIEDSRATFITYQSIRSTEPVTYDIHPYGFVEHRGTLYVVGFSCPNERVQLWKVDRMLDAEATDVPFSRPLDFDVQAYFEGAFAVVAGQESHAIRIRFTGSAARYVQEKRMHASQHVELAADGAAIVTFELTSTFEIKSWILSFGSAAEVLAPESLRHEIQQDLTAALHTYASEQVNE